MNTRMSADMFTTAPIVIHAIPTARVIRFLKWGLILVLFGTRIFAQENPHGAAIGECSTCHIENGWTMIHFNHDTTGYALTGAHHGLNCVECHDIADFKKIASDCRDCHTDVHQGSLNPQCNRCHNARGWTVLSPVEAHRSTFFQLLGAHASLDCYQCHRNTRNNDFRLNTALCVDCHRETYNGVSNPDHRKAGFGVVCEDCHNLLRWKPALFNDHDALFPIFSGTHAGEWSQCSTCHTHTSDYATFSCFGCHEHNEASTDSKHDEVSGYVYESAACYACHPQGNGEDD